MVSMLLLLMHLNRTAVTINPEMVASATRELVRIRGHRLAIDRDGAVGNRDIAAAAAGVIAGVDMKFPNFGSTSTPRAQHRRPAVV